MNNQNQIEAKRYSLSVLSLIAWVVGLGTALVGISLIVSHFLSGILVLLGASIILPPTYKAIKEKMNLSMSKGARIFFYTLFFCIGSVGVILSGDKVETVAVTAPVQQMVFDVPSLVGKDLKQLKQILGIPSYDKEPTPLQVEHGDTWEKSWKKDGYSLMVSYDIRTKKVIDLFLGAETDANYAIFENTNNILKIGNLQPNASEYSIKFVKAVNGPGYTGVIVKAR